MEIPRIHVHDDGVQTIGADQVFNIGTNQVFIRDIPRWLVDHPKTSIPQAPPATVIIGNPIIFFRVNSPFIIKVKATTVTIISIK